MNDIEIGEYVRINQGKFLGIGKVIRKVGNTIYIKMNISLPISFPEDEIKKYRHSKNIIDLIEIGDYVNGYEVLDLTGINGIENKAFTIFNDEQTDFIKVWKEQDIRSILTKEQFNKAEFIVSE